MEGELRPNPRRNCCGEARSRNNCGGLPARSPCSAGGGALPRRDAWIVRSSCCRGDPFGVHAQSGCNGGEERPLDLSDALARERQPAADLALSLGLAGQKTLLENDRLSSAQPRLELGYLSSNLVPELRGRKQLLGARGRFGQHLGKRPPVWIGRHIERRLPTPHHALEERGAVGAGSNGSNHPNVVHEVPHDERADPETRIRRELPPLARVEAPDRFDETQAPFLDQILELPASPTIAVTSDLDPQPQVRLDEPALQPRIPGPMVGRRELIL